MCGCNALGLWQREVAVSDSSKGSAKCCWVAAGSALWLSRCSTHATTHTIALVVGEHVTTILGFAKIMLVSRVALQQGSYTDEVQHDAV